MYLACADEEINKRQKAVKEENDRLIDSYNNLSFWRKFGEEQKLRERVIDNWNKFNVWMSDRIARYSHET